MAGLHVPLSTLRHSPRGPSTHDSGPSWIATPSMSGVLIPFLMPVYPGAFPTFTTTRSTRSVPSYTPAASPAVRRSPSPWPPRPATTNRLRSRPPPPRRACTADRPTSARFGAGTSLTEPHTLVPRVHLLALLAGPGPSGSTGPSRRCQGCSHPCVRLHAQAALSFTG